ncbi:MAG TPA: response regulator [Myxococcaceae bacterium]|nr:response regulator [Myxococcaceae bacterium]
MPEAGQSILLVDDDEAKRHVTSQILRRAGFEVIEASTGAQALSRIYEEPGLIILDVKLPDMDGFEVAARLKETPAARTPVLHLSATFVREEDRARGLEQGAVGYLTYPVEPTVLVAHARSLLRLGRYEWERERLLRRERIARSQAEQSQRQFRILAELGRIVTQGLPPDELVSAAIDLLVPGVADAVGLVRPTEEGGDTYEVTVRHREAALEPAIRKWCEAGAPQLMAAADMAELGDQGVISSPREGWSEVFGPQDLHLVPLRFGRTLEGALLLYRKELPRHLSGSLRDFYEDLGSRLAGALAHVHAYARMETEQRRVHAAISAQERFMENVARELRQPLVTVSSWLRVLARETLTPEQKVEALEMLQQSVRGQLDLVDELSDFARVVSRRVQLRREPVDLNALLARIFERFGQTAEEAQLTVEQQAPELPLWVEGDPTRLEQLLVAIIRNAVQYTERGGRIEAHRRVDGDLLHIEIRNSGVGIHPDDLPFVFDPFWRGFPPEQEHRGLGLSLPAARALAEQHGGHLRAWSEGPGTGATFTLTLPRLEAAPADDAGDTPLTPTPH